MPWCKQCDERLEPEELTEEGNCPTCGAEPLEHRPSPWYFKFMLVASVIYLGYRAFQGVTWWSITSETTRPHLRPPDHI